MQTKFIYILSLLALCAGCASTPPAVTGGRGPASDPEIANGNRQHFAEAGNENDDYDVDRGVQEKSCDIKASSRMLMKGVEKELHSHHTSLQAIKNAYKYCANIEMLHGGQYGLVTLAHNGWYCQRNLDPHAAPAGALVFEGNAVEVHFKTDKEECFVMDFHHKNCLPVSEFHHRDRKTYGWCTP